VPHQVSTVVPYLLERSLSISLTRQLVRTVTHALVPTVSYGLTRHPTQIEACARCRETGERCGACHDSPQVQYYTNYYSTYYSDYFSEYYGDYYASALLALDRRQHHREDENQLIRDSETANAAKDHNVGRGEFGKPALQQRSMSPSGLPRDPRVGMPQVGPSDAVRGAPWTRPTGPKQRPTIRGEVWGPPRTVERDGKL